jgi:DNA-binding CsgD family transcriptional regulator
VSFEAETVFKRHQDRRGLAVTLVNRAMNAIGRGVESEAQVWADEALRLEREIGDPGRISTALMNQQIIALLRGQTKHAQELLLEGLGIASERGDISLFTISLWLVMWLASLRGDHEWVLKLSGTESALRDQSGAILIPQSRRWRDAIVERARSTLGLGRSDAAWKQGRRLGMEEVLGYVAGRQATRPPLLSARELEVARLVAAGLADKQIARSLGIAPRTAATHVNNIRNKLGLQNRAQIAAWVTAEDPAST